MRLTIVIPLLILAGCGGEAEPEAKKSEKLAELETGQFELNSEVTNLSSVDQGAPAINTPAGTESSASVCLSGFGEAPTEMLSGEGYDCSYGNYYARNGRINATLNCTRPGLSGEIAMSVDGTFETGQLNFTRTIRTILASDGDVIITERVTGRRTGDCAAGEAAEGNQAKGG